MSARTRQTISLYGFNANKGACAGVYKPRADEIRIENDNYTVVESCDIEFNLTHNNKGFESIMFHDGGDDAKYLLGLCEGNHCAGGKAK